MRLVYEYVVKVNPPHPFVEHFEYWKDAARFISSYVREGGVICEVRRVCLGMDMEGS